ncbi:unnamed protein product [Closterium sp. NIES-54]
MWLDDLQVYLLSDSRDSVLLFDHMSGAAPAPSDTANNATRSQWLTCNAASFLAIRNHLPLVECAHFGQHGTAQTLYDAVVARYSSPATAALGRLLLPNLFPELSAFATNEDLVSHLRASDARYRAAAPAEFLDRNQPPMFITLYFIVTRLPDSLRSIRDHFLSLDTTSLTVDLLEQHLLAAETSVVAVGAAHGTLRMPFFEGCSPSPLAPSYASATAVDVLDTEDVGAASASAKRRSSKGKGGRGGGGGSGGGGGGSGGSGGGSGDVGGSGGGSGGSGSSGSGGTGGGRTGAQRGGSEGGQRQRHQHQSETPSPQQLRKAHTQHRCFSRLDDAWRAEFGDEVERPNWTELLRSGVAIFDLDNDAILSAMYALSADAEVYCYLCVLPDPGIEAAALGAGESSLPSTAPGEALHTFTLDSGASRCFFRDSTTLTPLPAPVPIRLADPSRGPIMARSSTVLPCPAALPSSLSGLHLPSFSTNLVSTAALQDAMVTTTTPGGQVAASFSCRLLSHQTLLWHHRLGQPSLPRLRGMHSRLLVSGLLKTLPPLPPSPAPPCLPCVEGRHRAAPHSSLFPPTTTPLQTLHIDMWGPARISGQGREHYFLLVVEDYTRYTTVFPLRSKGQVVDVSIPWIRALHLQLRERFRSDLPVLRVHSDRGGEFLSDLLRDFCRGEGILQLFTLPESPHQNGIAECRIGLVMEVARTSMIHAAAPHFLWPFAVQYAAHQLSLWPRVSFSETSPTLRWTGKVGDASVFRVDPLLGTAPVEVAVSLCAARGAASGVAASGGVEPGVAESEGAGFFGAEPWGEEPGGADPAGVEPRGAEPEGVEPGGAESKGAESGVAEPWGAASSGGPACASLRLSPQQLREWLVWRANLQSGATGAGDAGAGGAGVTGGAGGTGGTPAAGPGGARTTGTGSAGTGSLGGAGAGDPTKPGAAGAGGSGAGGTGAGGAGAGGAGAGGTDAGGAGAGGAGAVDPRGTVRP